MKNIRYIFSTVLLSIAVVGSTAGQDDPIKVETNLVTVNVSVTDQKGKQIAGLGRGDFTLLDGGQKRDIEAVFSENAPLSVGIVYDMHPTTGQQSEDVLKALKKFTSE